MNQIIVLSGASSLYYKGTTYQFLDALAQDIAKSVDILNEGADERHRISIGAVTV
jgi:hypothetical protein